MRQSNEGDMMDAVAVWTAMGVIVAAGGVVFTLMLSYLNGQIRDLKIRVEECERKHRESEDSRDRLERQNNEFLMTISEERRLRNEAQQELLVLRKEHERRGGR